MVLNSAQIIADKWVTIRNKRDRFLAETDWWGVSDRTMPSAQTQYRQNLRDLPASNAYPDAIVFPTKPS